MFINLNSYYVNSSPVNLNTTSMSKKFLVIGNLSLSRFFRYTKKFCDGYSLYETSLGRVKLVSFARDCSLMYESKIYPSYEVFKDAESKYINRQLRKL